jgi:hypothetical protein
MLHLVHRQSIFAFHRQDRKSNAAGSRSGLRLAIDQDRLLPSAGRLVGAVDAAGPATRAFHALPQFFAGAVDAALASCGLFRIIDPADELIAPEWRQAFPERENLWVGAHGRL